MNIEIKNPKLGPVFIVINAYIRNGYLSLLVNHTQADSNIITDDINETTSNAFLFIVELFIKANDIDFKPSGNFEVHVTKRGYWEFFITGTKIDPMEYFVDNLNK